MKNILHILIVLLALTLPTGVHAQNIPNGSYGNGLPTYVVPRPADFSTVSPTWPTYQKYNYLRLYTPTEPVNSIGSGTKMTIATTYLDGWGRAMQEVINPGAGKPQVYKPFDLRAGRTSVDYLSYPVTGGDGKFRRDAYTEQKDYYDNKYPLEGETGYSKTMATNTTGNPVIRSSAPGEEFTGKNRGATQEVHIGGSGDLGSMGSLMVLEYSGMSDQVCDVGSYGTGDYIVKWTKGEHNSEVAEFLDKTGKLLAKKIRKGAGQYLQTYYVYNELDQLVATVPPAEVNEIIANGCVGLGGGSPYVNKGFGYEYNEYGQPVNTRTPGKEGSERVVYDRYHRVFLSQTPQMADEDKAFFTLYDKLGRVLITGMFDETHDMDQSYYDGIMSGSTALPAYLDGLGNPVSDEQKLEYYVLNDMKTNDYPEDANGEPYLASCEIYTLNYYDNYDVSPANLVSFDGSYDIHYNTTAHAMEIPQPYPLVHGSLVASKVRILDNGFTHNWGSKQWVTSVFFYDEKGRNIQTHTLNPWREYGSEAGWDVVTNQYNFNGQPIRVIFDHKGMGTGGNLENGLLVLKDYTYDINTGRLLQTQQKTGQGSLNPWYNINNFEYNDLGQVYQKSLGLVEYQLYSYNIRGQVKAINDLYINTLTPSTADKRTFAERLEYEHGYTDKRYDGRLTGYMWRTAGTADLMSYGYEYDESGRMTHAEYRYDNGSSWVKTNKDYTVSSLEYDDNGNMTAMNQRGEDQAMSGPTIIDELAYDYDASGTRLLNVTDIGNASSGRINDFVDGQSTTGDDYEYDKDGHLIKDQNRGVSNLVYNTAGQLVEITKGIDGDVKNIYTADGKLLQKTITDNTQSPAVVTTYRYWGPIVYNDGDVEMVMHDEGRARYIGPAFAYDYFVKDHLGNVRNIVKGTMEYVELEYKAGFELVSATVEEAVFTQIGVVRDNKPLGTPGDLSSGILNGGVSTERIGAAVMVHAMSGEKFNVRGWGYYDNTDTSAYNMYPMSEYMLESLLDAMTDAAAPGIGENGLAHTETVANLLSNTNYNLYEGIRDAVTNTAYPRAYLNYLVFDENFELQTDHSKVVQLTGSANSWHLMDIQGDQVMPINGYVLMYFSNESHIDVAVDNLHIINYESELLEEQHYYPHGLVIEEAGQGTVNPENQYLAQGNKLQKELGLFINDFNFRQYDAQIGRFLAVDPLASDGQESFNPYHFVYNDPANYIDPLGLKGGDGVLGEEVDIMVYNGGHYDPVTGWVNHIYLYRGWVWYPILSGSPASASGGEFSPGPGYGSGVRRGGGGGGGNPAKNAWRRRSTGTLSRYGTTGAKPITKPYSAQYYAELELRAYTDAAEAKHAETQQQINSNIENNNSGWTSTAGQGNWYFGAIASMLEMSSSYFRTHSDGYGFSPWIYSENYPASPYFNRYSMSKLGNTLGKVSFGLGVAFDLYGVRKFYTSPNSPNAVHPAKAAVNTGVGAYGVWVNPAGALMYFGIDAFYPGGWPGAMHNMNETQKANQQILGPSWRLIPFQKF